MCEPGWPVPTGIYDNAFHLSGNSLIQILMLILGKIILRLKNNDRFKILTNPVLSPYNHWNYFNSLLLQKNHIICFAFALLFAFIKYTEIEKYTHPQTNKYLRGHNCFHFKLFEFSVSKHPLLSPFYCVFKTRIKLSPT